VYRRLAEIAFTKLVVTCSLVAIVLLGSSAARKRATSRRVESKLRQVEEQCRNLETQVQYAQKLESLGVLAGGIAHDFNNLLMGILGHASLALGKLPPTSEARKDIQKIESVGLRAAELTNQLLAYSGKGTFTVTVVNPSNLVAEMGSFLYTVISKHSVVRYGLSDDPTAVEGDASQLRQVVMNLILNASEALQGLDGTIDVRTGDTYASRQYLQKSYLDDNLPSGRYVYLDVIDTGCGMDEPTLLRIFDPFFTTKFTGRGLGLAAVLGIVRGHHGTLRITSAAGSGTSVRVLLPLTEAAEENRREDLAPRSLTRVSGSVLVVDDEDAIRSVSASTLERYGFTVLEARDGLKGVEIFSRHQNEISAVVLDLTMPHVDGEAVLREIRQIRPEIPVILSSGYSEHDIKGRFAADGFTGFLQKPYPMRKLVEKVCEALQR